MLILTQIQWLSNIIVFTANVSDASKNEKTLTSSLWGKAHMVIDIVFFVSKQVKVKCQS